MVLLLIFLLAIYQLHRPVYSEISYAPTSNLNSLLAQGDNDLILPPDLDSQIAADDIPLIRDGLDQTEIKFRKPIKAVNIDYSKNSIGLKFRNRFHGLDPEEIERRKSLESNFMRFGRDPASNFMRLGKRAVDQIAKGNSIDRNGRSGLERFERSSENFDKSGNVGLRDSRGDNFMRFGRDSYHDYMRFGRSPGQDYMRFGRDPSRDYMRFGRSPGQDYMRFGRNPGQNYMRFGRSVGQDYMRFGRNPGHDYMRFGRDPGRDYMRLGRSPGQDYMRFGRAPADFMRLGRNPAKDFMRFGRAETKELDGTDKNFMRFGRAEPNSNADRSSNFMRFGRMNGYGNVERNFEDADDKESNSTASTRLIQKNDVKEAAKLLHETDSSNEESNPMDKAIQVLFGKHDNEEAMKSNNSDENSSLEEEY